MSLSTVSFSSVFRQDKFDKTDGANGAWASNGALLDMLAEVASQKLYNEVSDKKMKQHESTIPPNRSKKRNSLMIKSYDKDVACSPVKPGSTPKKYPPYNMTVGRGPLRYSTMTANQIRALSGSQLVKLFTVLEGDEMKRTFYFQCRFLPDCQERFFSFGSEEKARHLVKQHLNKHVQQLSSDHIIEVPNKYEHLYKRQLKSLKKMTVPKAKNISHNNKCNKGKKKKVSVEMDDLKRKLPVDDELNKIKKNKGSKEESDKDIAIPVSDGISLVNGDNDKGETVGDNDTGETMKDHNYYRYPNEVDVKISDKTASCAYNDGDKFIVPDSDRVPNFSSIYCEVLNTDGCKEYNNNVGNSDINCCYNIVESPDDVCNKADYVIVKEEGSALSYGNGGADFVAVAAVNNEVDTSFNYLTMPVEQEVEVKTENSTDDISINEEINVDEFSMIRNEHLLSEMDSFDVGNGIELNALPVLDDKLKMTPPIPEKKPKGKAKFIGCSAEEREMAVEMIKAVKRGGGGLECRICEPKRVFTAPTTLISHYRSHAGIKPYECVLCKAVFTRQHSLNYHLLIHLNQTRFTCNDCGRKFRHPSHFKEHQRRHTGESPFQCPDCTQRFKTRNTYKRHLKTRHGKILTHSGAIITVTSDTGTEQSSVDTNSYGIKKEIVGDVIGEMELSPSNNSLTNMSVICSNDNSDLDKENNSVADSSDGCNKNEDMAVNKAMMKRIKMPVTGRGRSVKITKRKHIDDRVTKTSALLLNILPQHHVLQSDNSMSAAANARTGAVLLLTTSNNNICKENNLITTNILNHANILVEKSSDATLPPSATATVTVVTANGK